MASVTYASNACLVKMPPVMEFKGKLYRYVQIGTKQILCEFIDIGDTAHSVKKPNGICYIDYYYLNTVFADAFNENWHFLNPNDITYVLNQLGGNTTENCKKLMGYKNDSWPGTNETTINLLPFGRLDGFNFQTLIDTDKFYFTVTDTPDRYLAWNTNTNLLENGTSTNFGSCYAVRLARDV